MSFIFWVDAVIGLFFGLLFLIDAYKYKQSIFRMLLMVYAILVVKSLIMLGMNYLDVRYVTEAIANSEATRQVIDKAMVPLYQFKTFIYNALDLLFIMAVVYTIVFDRKESEDLDTRLPRFLMLVQFLALGVITVGVTALSLIAGDKTTYQTTIGFVEMFKGPLGKVIFAGWKIVLLVVVWQTLSGIFGYLLNIMKNVAKYRRRLFTFLVLEIIFAFFTALPFVQLYTQPNWFVFHTISLLFFTVFAFGNHTLYITALQEKVISITKERDVIITLMREISAIVGMGDFDLETVLTKIVGDSTHATAARGGAALIRDPVTNRLNVRHVEGFYPPTKAFKTSGGVTLTENVILSKFKAEKIAVGEGLLGKVAQDGKPLYIPDTAKYEGFEQTVSDHMTVTSLIAVPLKTKDEIFGVLTIVDDVKHFSENDLGLIETLAEQAAITITQIQMYQAILEKQAAEKEIGVAAEIQSSLIPHTFPETDKFEIYGFSIPAKGVGGDYYDYINFGNNKIAMCMFDVSGKGVPASLIMVMIRSILRTIASLNEDTKDVVKKLNNTIAGEIVEDRYATGFYLLFDAEKGIMSYTNAGHGPLVLYRAATDEFEFLDTEGMPVGIMGDVEYGQNYTILEKGDIAILYTDGISEAMNLAHEEFGMERFKEVIRKYKRESARELANRVLEAITVFAGSAPQHDDETLLVLKNK